MPKRINPGKRTERVKARLEVWLRFLDKVLEDQHTGCWEWDGYKDANGYGQFRVGGKTWWAHRWAYAAWKGEIPDGMDIDHVCRNPSCVNPDHLRSATIRQNRGRVEAPLDGIPI